jgi:hypothetical protein
MNRRGQIERVPDLQSSLGRKDGEMTDLTKVP